MDAYEYAILKNEIDKKTGQEVAQQLPDLVPPAVEDYCEENFSEWSGALDSTLTQPLMAAPADKVGEIKSALTIIGEVAFLATQYRQGYLSTGGTYNTSDSGKSYAIDISACTETIYVALQGNNQLRYGLYTKTIDNVTSSDTADLYKQYASPYPNGFNLNPTQYSGYKTLIVTTDYNNANPSKIQVYEEAVTKAQLQTQIDTLDYFTSNNIVYSIPFESGTIKGTDGTNDTSNARIRTIGYVPKNAGVLTSTDSDGEFIVMAYENGTFKGGFSDNEFVVNKAPFHVSVDFSVLRVKFPTYDYRVVYAIDGGSATMANLSDLKLTSVFYPSTTGKESKVRVMYNNIGGFNMGVKHYVDGVDMRMTTEQAQEKIANYKQFYAQYQPDVLALEEFPMVGTNMSNYIDKSDTIDPNVALYPYIYPYSTDVYQFAVIKSNLPMTFKRNLAISLEGFDKGFRGVMCEFVTNEGFAVGVISTVFDVNGTEANRTAQMNKAIELLTPYRYGMVCVDTNMLSQPEYEAMVSLFTTANYQTVNGTFYPLTDTCPAASYKPIDNIFVKGNAKIKSFVVPQVLDELASDHLPIASDILFY